MSEPQQPPKPAANETAVLVNPAKMPPTAQKPNDSHPHHGMEVVCKGGTEQITIQPMVGHEHQVKYVRTTDTDEVGRIVFRPESG